MVEHAATERPYNPLWDEGAKKRGKRRGSRLGVVLSAVAHAALVYVVYESKFAPRYQQYGEPPPIVAKLAKVAPEPPPEAPKPPPPKLERPPEPPPLTPHVAPLQPSFLNVQPIPVPPPTKTDPPIVDLPPPPPAPRVITNPNWSSKPSGDDVARYYPERAQRLEKPGKALLECRVTAKGAVADCAVQSEDPAEFGFGEAALKLSRLFKMRPKLEDGQAVEGATVRIPIVFRIAD